MSTRKKVVNAIGILLVVGGVTAVALQPATQDAMASAWDHTIDVLKCDVLGDKVECQRTDADETLATDQKGDQNV